MRVAYICLMMAIPGFAAEPIEILKGTEGLVADPSFHPKAGDKAVIATFAGGKAFQSFGAVTIFDLGEYAKAHMLKDDFALAEVQDDDDGDRIINLAHGTPVLLLTREVVRVRTDRSGGFDVAEVRVLDGKHKGEKLWALYLSLARLIPKDQADAMQKPFTLRELATAVVDPRYVPIVGGEAHLVASVGLPRVINRAQPNVWSADSFEAMKVSGDLLLVIFAPGKVTEDNVEAALSLKKLTDKGILFVLPVGEKVVIRAVERLAPPYPDAVQVEVMSGRLTGGKYWVSTYSVNRVITKAEIVEARAAKAAASKSKLPSVRADTIYRMGQGSEKTGNVKAALGYYRDLVAKHPDAEKAKLASERIKAIEAKVAAERVKALEGK